MNTINKLISGGQTGGDRAALDFAIANGIPHGGWCPKGRKAEDGPIDAKYLLQETPTADYLERTEWNIRDSHGTLILTIGAKLTGGSKRTAEIARKLGKPCLHISKEGTALPVSKLTDFLAMHTIDVLNVAGPRASKEPAVGEFVTQVLTRLFRKS